MKKPAPNDHVLIVKMPAAVRLALERLARARGLGLSATVRTLILDAARTNASR